LNSTEDKNKLSFCQFAQLSSKAKNIGALASQFAHLNLQMQGVFFEAGVVYVGDDFLLVRNLIFKAIIFQVIVLRKVRCVLVIFSWKDDGNHHFLSNHKFE